MISIGAVVAFSSTLTSRFLPKNADKEVCPFDFSFEIAFFPYTTAFFGVVWAADATGVTTAGAAATTTSYFFWTTDIDIYSFFLT